jgi:hypothetical protein
MEQQEKIYSWGGGFASNIPPNYIDEYCLFDKDTLNKVLNSLIGQGFNTVEIKDNSIIATVIVENPELINETLLN